MTNRQVILTGGLVGAAVGMATGFLFFTPEGRRWRTQAERQLGVLLEEAERLLQAADQVRQSVADFRAGQSGWPRSA